MSSITAWPSQAESWLDERGKPAWIAAMVVGFVVFWPIGLAILAYMIWGKRMFGHSCGQSRDGHRSYRYKRGSSGNSAFDSYKADMINRLEREQDEFQAFLKRLRDSKDKTEFDAYMDERARAARDDEPPRAASPGTGTQSSGAGAY